MKIAYTVELLVVYYRAPFLDHLCSSIIFSDNTNLFIPDSNIENLFEIMNEELRKVAIRFKANKLSLNISKIKYSLFYSTRKRKNIPNYLRPLHACNAPVKR